MKVNLFGHVFGNLGYNVHTRGFAEGMMENDIDVKIHPFDAQPIGEPGRMIMESIRKKPHYDSPSVCLSYGNDMMKFHGTKRIGYSVWETTRIPEDWVTSLNKLDDVWTVSKFCKKAFEDSGVAKDVKVVHEGVDTSIFNKYVDKFHRIEEEENKFLFASIFKWEDRKSPDLLIKAFSEEFENEKDAMLLLQCYNPFLQNFNPFEEIVKMNVKVGKKLQILPPFQKRTDLAKFYRTVDCFVLPTKGESWGLPLIEAMACGTPVITTNWGGALEFVKSDYGWLIDVDHMETPNDGVWFKPYKDNEWAVPSLKSLKEQMRYAFEHRDECKKKGLAAYDYVDENFNWKKSTEVVKELLKE